MSNFVLLLFIYGTLFLDYAHSATNSIVMECKDPSTTLSRSVFPSIIKSNLSGASEKFLQSYVYLLDAERNQMANHVSNTLKKSQLSGDTSKQQKLDRRMALIHRVNVRRQLLESTDRLNQRIQPLVQSIRLRKDFVDCGFTDEEIFAIYIYTTTLYRQINFLLRENKSEKMARIQAFVESIKSGLDKIAPYEGQVLRGTMLPEHVRAKYCVDCTVSDPAFTSTSPTIQYSGKYHLVIESKTGKFIGPLSSSSGVKEVLFKPHAKFKILNISKGIDKKRRSIEKFQMLEIP